MVRRDTPEASASSLWDRPFAVLAFLIFSLNSISFSFLCRGSEIPRINCIFMTDGICKQRERAAVPYCINKASCVLTAVRCCHIIGFVKHVIYNAIIQEKSPYVNRKTKIQLFKMSKTALLMKVKSREPCIGSFIRISTCNCITASVMHKIRKDSAILSISKNVSQSLDSMHGNL